MIPMDSTPAGLPACPYAQAFEATVDEIVKKIPAYAPSAAYREIIHEVTQLKERLEARLSPTHYPARRGRHRCVSLSFEFAHAYLKGLAIVASVPPPQLPPQPAQPPAPEPPRPPRHPFADVLREMESVMDNAGEEG